MRKRAAKKLQARVDRAVAAQEAEAAANRELASVCGLTSGASGSRCAMRSLMARTTGDLSGKWQRTRGIS